MNIILSYVISTSRNQCNSGVFYIIFRVLVPKHFISEQGVSTIWVLVFR